MKCIQEKIEQSFKLENMSWIIYSTGNLPGLIKKIEDSNILEAIGDSSNPYQLEQYLLVKAFLKGQFELMKRVFKDVEKIDKIYFDLEARGHIEVEKRFNLFVKVDRAFLDIENGKG